MPSVHDQLSAQFYKWEIRGRGWNIYQEPVQPEPPFATFSGHFLSASPAIDDGRRPSFLGSLFGSKPSTAAEVIDDEDEPEPHFLVRDTLVELHTSLPADLDIAKDAFVHFLGNLALCREPISFELLGAASGVSVQFASSKTDGSNLRRQLQAHFPDAVFQTPQNTLQDTWEDCQGEELLVVEFGLAREFMFPLASGKLDPFIGLIAALAELQPNDLGLFQILFQPVRERWAESIVASVSHADGKPFFVNQPELTKAAENKVASPLYAAVVRIAIKADDFERVMEIASDMAGSLRVFAHPHGNELIPLKNDEYPFEEHVADVLSRQSRRSGMILNTEELIGFVHLPSSAVRSPVLKRDAGLTKAAPPIVQNARGLLLGENVHLGESLSVRLTPEQRVYHSHLIGATGTGKSTLLFNLIRQDVENGEGIAVLDPHGDLVDKILGIIPQERINDVVLVDPSDEEYSIGFNILSAHSEQEKTLLASDLVSVFQRLSTSWGDQMQSVLQNAILAFLNSSRPGTLADMRRFLVEPAFRTEFLRSVSDPNILYYWQKGFSHLSGNKSIGPIITRLEMFLAQRPIAQMVSQPGNKLDFGQIMDTGKIFLARLPEGLLGRENSYLLGAVLVSKFQQLVMARQAKKIAARRDFWIYIDEFANFITPTMAEILSGARKYRIGLTLAHHELHQLQRSPEVASAVMTHPFTRVVFRVGDDDARKLSDGFSFFEASHLKNLEAGQAICRVQRSNFDFNLTVPIPDEVDAATAAQRREEVITASREKYSRPRAEVEMILAKLREPVTQIKPLASPLAASSTLIIPQPSETPKISEVPRTLQPVSDEKPESALIGNEDESQHLAIKNKIGAEAETLDFTVTYEEHFPTVKGRADIVLRRGALAVVVQVSVTTPVGFEVESVQKFLQADFKNIAVICANRKKLSRIKQSLGEAIATEHSAKVGCYTQDEFILKLYDWATADPQGAVIERGKPRKQKINLSAAHLTSEERQQREAELLKKLSETMKRKPNT